MSELTGINYLTSTPEFPCPYQFSPNFNLLSHPNNSINGMFTNNSYSPTQTSLSPVNYMSSTSDESEEIHQTKMMIDERRQRRMISNRESARRSRMRKQRHLDELWSHVIRLRNENNNLVDKLTHVSESHDRVLQENVKLKEEAADLRQMISNMQLANSSTNTSPLNDGFRDNLEDTTCTTAHLRAESSNHSIGSSTTDLLL
ncbi:Basic leucine zipper 43 [Bienertia sinuspersici]